MDERSRERGAVLGTLARIGRDPAGVLGLVMVATVTLAAVGAPLLSPYEFDAIGGGRRLTPPGPPHWLGTDELGRDLLSRVLWGARISLPISLAAAGLSCGVGILLGTAAGYYRGRLDLLVMRAMEVLLAFPGLVLALTLIAVMGPGLGNLVLALGISGIPTFARLARAMTFSVSAEPYTESARAVGANDLRIMTRYVLPNSMAPVIVTATSSLGGLILAEAGLSFLGVGIQPPMPSWGTMISSGKSYIEVSPWLMIWPGLAIFVAVLGFSLLGDAVRDATDPRLRRS